MNINFEDCNSAKLDYSLTEDGLNGQIDLIRAIPNSQALCEELSETQ